jgi:hypothetical protein
MAGRRRLITRRNRVTELAGIETTDQAGPSVVYEGVIILEFAEPRRRSAGVEPLAGWQTCVLDALNGKPITTVTRVEVHVPANDMVTADVTMFADLDGRPVFDGKPFIRGQADLGGEVVYGTFPFLVAEIRNRKADPPKAALEPKFQEPCAS